VKFHVVRSVHDGTTESPSTIRSSNRDRAIRMRRPRRIAPCSEKLEAAADAKRHDHQGASVEIWAMDEHRIGLKPIQSGVQAPVGEPPIPLSQHRL
jgi:hypothetical protein